MSYRGKVRKLLKLVFENDMLNLLYNYRYVLEKDGRKKEANNHETN